MELHIAKTVFTHTRTFTIFITKERNSTLFLTEQSFINLHKNIISCKAGKHGVYR